MLRIIACCTYVAFTVFGGLVGVALYNDYLAQAEFDRQQELARQEHLCWYYGSANGGIFCEHAKMVE